MVRGAAGLVLGAIAGSFLATILIRWPQGRGAMTGRSHCDACDAALGPAELVPVLSYLLARGRCRRCAARIDPRHLAVELAAALIGVVSFLAHSLPLGLVSALLGWWLLLVALLDLEHHWLPDRLTLPLIPLGLVVAWTGLGPLLVERLAGAAIGWGGLALIALGYRSLRGREGLGGGDPKLFGALGAWVGAFHLPFVLLGAGLIGLASVLLMRARGEAVGATTRLPLGTFLALAGWPIWLIVATRPLFGIQ
ncbi:A24 family peptidase [Sphingosinicella sp. LHD-64]|nr:A24 family peptidase [Sphingosinicella sp. LHD-64]MDQ8755669.1 A24 family peptidase [Sphingosinicella sp. LHD-64]